MFGGRVINSRSKLIQIPGAPICLILLALLLTSPEIPAIGATPPERTPKPADRAPLTWSPADDPAETLPVENGMAKVIIYLKAQPVHGYAPQVQSAHQPAVDSLRRRLRAMQSGDGGYAAPEKQAASESLQQALEAELGAMRREIFASAEAEIEAAQAELVSWLEAAGAEIHSRIYLVNAVAASVPVERLEELRALPDVAEVVGDRLMTAQLNVSHYAINTDTWNANGYSGGGTWEVGIVDSGVDVSHPNLDHLTWEQSRCLAEAGNPSSDPTVDDVNGHGTHVAGIVLNDNSTYWGIAWNAASAFNLKAGFDFDGNDGGWAFMQWSDMIDCVDWSLRSVPDPADAFNLSYGGCTSIDDSAVARFWDAVVYDMQAPVTLPAGNYSMGSPCTRYVGDPAIAYNAITVGNVDDHDTASASNPQRGDDTIDPDSSLGPTPGGRRKPDLGAPGTFILSTNNSWEGGESDLANYSGTSMAAPHVTGALMLMMNYGITDPLAQKAILVNTAEDKGSPGWDPAYGWGYIDLDRAWGYRDEVLTGNISPAPDYRLYQGWCNPGEDATLAWYRRAVYNQDRNPNIWYTLSDLDLHLYSEFDNSLMDSDTTAADNVQQVTCAGSGTSVVSVDAYSASFAGASTEAYALATGHGYTPASGPAFSFTPTLQDRCIGAQWDEVISVNNIGDLAAHNVSATLTVPAGLSLVAFPNPQNVGTIQDGGSQAAFWTLRADAPGTYTVGIDASSSSYGHTFTGIDSYPLNVVGTALQAPALALPVDGDGFCGDTPTFDWADVSEADSYTIQVDDDVDFSSPVIEATTSVSDYTPATGLAEGTYYWRIAAVNHCGPGAWSPAWSLVLLTASTTPALGYPGDGNIVCSSNPAFDWADIGGPNVSYHIQVDDDTDFSSPAVDADASASEYTPIISLTPETNYFWHVLAEDACGTSPYSPARSFLTRFPPISPILVSPASGTWTTSTYLTFDWQDVPLANKYHIRIASDPGFTVIVLHDVAINSEYLSPIPFPFGHYWWEVVGGNSCGLGATSPPWDFLSPLFSYFPIGFQP